MRRFPLLLLGFAESVQKSWIKTGKNVSALKRTAENTDFPRAGNACSWMGIDRSGVAF
jgi:hypothetical protein